MSQSEADVSPQVVQAMQASGCQIFRNNRGVAKMGPYWVRYGVGPNGAGDWIGFKPVRITPEMVGHLVAVFVSAETKRPVGAKYDPNQSIWRDTVIAAGGIAGIVHSWEQGRALVMDWFKRFEPKKKVAPKRRKA